MSRATGVTSPIRFRRLLGRLLGPLNRRLLRDVPVDDVWERVTSLLVTPHLFGPGSRRTFSWYLEGESTVDVSGVDELCEWLVACEYLADDQLFNESDFWQHPRTFEHLRKGDCEDHALWAWRKLIETGHQAEFFVGRWLTGESNGHNLHAWVVFERDGERFLFEAIDKDVESMIRPLRDVRAEYSPHFSVDHAFTMHSYAGYLLYLKERAASSREWRVGPPSVT
jgi:hypothetical protein